MNRVKVTCEIMSYDEPAKSNVRVHSHWNQKEKVVLEIEDVEITVVAHDLITAIENCTNTGRLY